MTNPLDEFHHSSKEVSLLIGPVRGTIEDKREGASGAKLFCQEPHQSSSCVDGYVNRYD
jgi:hypothetical protein